MSTSRLCAIAVAAGWAPLAILSTNVWVAWPAISVTVAATLFALAPKDQS